MSVRIENERRNNRLSLWAAFAAGLTILAVPAIAMQFTQEVNWTLSDFVVMAALLAGLGATLALTAKAITNRLLRTIASAIVLLVFIALWVELATGGLSRRLAEV